MYAIGSEAIKCVIFFPDNLLINIFGHILVFMKRTCLNEKIMQDVLGVKTSFYVQ